MSKEGSFKRFVKKTILISGAVVRSAIGIGAAALLLFGLKKKK